MTYRRILALDGGHTRTRAIVVDESGSVLAQGVAGPVAPYYGPEDLKRALEQVRQVIEGCRNQLEDTSLAAVCCGMTTGGEHSPFTPPLRQVLDSLKLAPHINVRDDFEMSLMAASGGLEDGVIVIAGGGSIAFGCRAGQVVRSGGWGTFFGDEGSAISIGKMALNAIARSLDGRDAPTLLTQAVLDHFGETQFRQVVRRIFLGTISQTQVADLTPLVAICAAAGDKAARNVLNWAGEELASIAAAVVGKLASGGDIMVYTTGGVFNEKQVLLPEFERVLKLKYPNLQVSPARYPPIIGCVIHAFRCIGIEPTSAALEQTHHDLTKIHLVPHA